MQEPTTGGTELVAIDLAGTDAATAIGACWDDGESVVVMDPSMTEAAKFAALRQLRPTALVDARGRRPMEGIPAPQGAAAVVMTSGTGAHPKAVTLTRTGLEAMAVAYSAAINASADDTWLAVLPLTGVAGLATLARSYATGIPAVVHETFVTGTVARAAARREATVVSLVPTALRRLLDAGAPLDRFRIVLVGGAPLPDSLRGRAVATGATIVTTYGLTETWGGFALDGRPIGEAAVRIAEDGEIEVSGPMVMHSYRRDSEATADALRDGWLRTGDLGAYDNATLTVTGRKADRIITGGINVSPAAVEQVLLTDDRVVDAAVVGAADEEWGERVVAYLVPANPANVPTLDDVRRLVKDRLPAANAPREVHPVSTIPRNAAGKIMRRELGR